MRTCMRKVYCLLPILILVISHTAAGQEAANPTLTPSAKSALTLKSVELEDTYRIQVPNDFTVDRVPDIVSSVPMYVFHRLPPHHTTIQVMVLPYSDVRRYGLVPINEETGLFALPFTINGALPAFAYFNMPGGQYAYYGWTTGDTAYACTMNSPCPHKTPRNSRYQTQYHFVVFNKPNEPMVEFIASYSGASKSVTGFRGDGKLLRDVIVPSLAPIH
jgi:hypothetical protein